MKAKFLQLCLLLCLLAALTSLAADPATPRLTGLVQFGNQSYALLALPGPGRISSSPLLLEGYRHGPWEVVRIDAASGNVTLRDAASGKDLSLAFTNAAAMRTTPATLRFEAMPLDQVLDVYQTISERSLVRSTKLPQATFDLRTGGLGATNDLLRALKETLAQKAVTIEHLGTKFSAAIPSSQARQLASLKPPPREETPNTVNGPASSLQRADVLPRAMLRFSEADFLQVREMYAQFADATILSVAASGEKLTLCNQTPLTGPEVIWLIEASFHLAGVSNHWVSPRLVALDSPDALRRLPPFDPNAAASRARGQTEPVDAPFVQAGVHAQAQNRDVLDLYAKLTARQPMPIPENVPDVRWCLRGQKPLPPAEAVYALEALAALHNLAFEFVGDDKVRLIPRH